MAGLSLADVLIDFGERRLAGPNPAAELSFPPEDGAAPFADIPGDESPFDVDQAIAEAVVQAEARLTERLLAETEESLAAERERHAAELAALRDSLATAAGEEIARRLAGLEETLLRLTGDAVARLLAPILSTRLQASALGELSIVIGDALGDSEAVRVRVRGPQSLFTTLANALGDAASRVDYIESDDFDLTVSVDESLYETRLSEWSRSISEAVE